jgi:hypothetical protein|tara:strand:- start:3258 stop:3476 length:219 start_codon:yes stop_codon:yes gene_type:complete
MDTKNSKGAYKKYADLSFMQDESKKETVKSGLLTPTKVSDRMQNSNLEEPAYRIAKYISSIRALNPKKNMVS